MVSASPPPPPPPGLAFSYRFGVLPRGPASRLLLYSGGDSPRGPVTRPMSHSAVVSPCGGRVGFRRRGERPAASELVPVKPPLVAVAGARARARLCRRPCCGLPGRAAMTLHARGRGCSRRVVLQGFESSLVLVGDSLAPTEPSRDLTRSSLFGFRVPGLHGGNPVRSRPRFEGSGRHVRGGVRRAVPSSLHAADGRGRGGK